MLLNINVESQGAQSATLPVGWSVTPELVAALKDVCAIRAYVLFSVICDGKEKSRHLAPLEQGMSYLTFPHPGEFTVAAAVFYCRDNKDTNLKEFLLAKSSRYQYENPLFSHDGGDIIYAAGIKNGGCLAAPLVNIKVAIAPEFFAPEPPEWEERFVNWLYSYPAADQCDYRQRRLIAYPLYPFLMLASLLIRLVAALWLVLHGMRDISFKAIWDIIHYDVDDVWASVGAGDSVFISRKTDYRRTFRSPRPFYQVLFMPFVILYSFAIVYLTPMAMVLFIQHKDEKDNPGAGVLLVLLVVMTLLMVGSKTTAGKKAVWAEIISIIGVASVATWFYLMRYIGPGFWLILSLSLIVPPMLAGLILVINETHILFDKLDYKLSKLNLRRGTLAQSQPSQSQPVPLPTIDIPVNTVIATRLEQLPPERRTIYLRFMDLKARVCKPYARRF